MQRVQLGVTLSPADRLPAINGAYADIVRRLRNRIDTTPGFETYLKWGKARGKDFQALAQIVYLIARGNQPRKAEPQTSRLEAFLALGGDDTASLEETAVNVMDIFCRIVGDPELGRPLHRKLSPLEMVMSGYLIYLYRTKSSDTQLSDAIAYMRKDIKAFAPEPRFNTQNFKRLLNFVSKDVQKLISNLKTAGVKEKPAIQLPCTRLAAPTGLVKESSVVSEFSGPSSSKAASEPVKTTRKRKRPATPEKEESDSDLAMPPKKAPRKSESKLTAEVRNETSRSILEKAAASKKASAARTSVKKALPKGPHRKATLDHLDTSPVVSPGERSSVSTTNTVLGAQVAKPTVKPSSAARTSPAFSQHTGASRSPSVDNPSFLGSAPHPTSSPSAPPLQTSASAVKPPLPGRTRQPGASPPSAMQVEQDFQLPSARSTALPKAAFLFDSSVHVTRAEDLGPDAGGVPPPASASSSSSCLPPSPSVHTATTAAKGKLPNIKFNKLRHVSEEDHSSPNENEDRWQRGSSALLDSIGGASNAKASSSASPALRTPQIAQGSSSSSSSPMVSQHVLAPQPPARPNSAGSGAHNPGRPLTPMATPSPTFPYSQPPRNTSSAGVPPPSSATGRQNNMAASSNGASGSNASGPRAARAHPFGLLMRARYHPETVDVRKRRLEGLQAKLPPRSSFQDNATTSDPPRDAPKRPRANRCRM
ncbi:hypothetical protein M413DRAFT_377500 [Hebeloma cylindrosporum]|uniref:Uncharacterized protein n=1 Tax=Hebeloma cylindrosporum TaxID=76867 RepID=A0A0C3CJG5_HEBCY|nr:hypothetical protein M413DRAFT_377500 [Hebeloma cylindrosporum h7]